MKEQFIHINTHGDKKYHRDKAMTILHREDGPAVECEDGSKYWCINGNRLTEEEFNARKNSCNGKIIEVDGKKYKLMEL